MPKTQLPKNIPLFEGTEDVGEALTMLTNARAVVAIVGRPSADEVKIVTAESLHKNISPTCQVNEIVTVVQPGDLLARLLPIKTCTCSGCPDTVPCDWRYKGKPCLKDGCHGYYMCD